MLPSVIILLNSFLLFKNAQTITPDCGYAQQLILPPQLLRLAFRIHLWLHAIIYAPHLLTSTKFPH